MWRVEPVIDWLLREGRLAADPLALVDALAARLLTAGAQVWRLRLAFFTLHPQLAAQAYVWMRGRATSVEQIPHGVQQTDAYLGSPAQRMIDSGKCVHYRLNRLAASDHRLLHRLAAEGGTDYALLPLRFSDGSLHVLAVATDDARGFDDRDLANFEALSRGESRRAPRIADEGIGRAAADDERGRNKARAPGAFARVLSTQRFARTHRSVRLGAGHRARAGLNAPDDSPVASAAALAPRAAPAVLPSFPTS